MRVKYGAIIVNARGRLGGHAATDNASGNIVVTAAIPPLPRFRSSSRSKPLQRHTASRQAYKALTIIQQQQWKNETANYPRLNAVGNQYKMTGQQLFCSLNNNLQNIGAAIISVPAPKIIPPMSPLFTIAATHAGPSLGLTYASAQATSSDIMIVQASPNMSNGRSSPGNSMRQIANIALTGQGSDNILTNWQDVFGGSPLTGQRIFVSVYIISYSCGAATPIISNVCVVS